MRLAKWNTEERVQKIIDFSSHNFDFQSKHVLDIGCNTGHFSHAAVSLGASVTALDRNASYANLTKNIVECQTVVADIFDYDMPAFDIILCCGVIYHTERQLELVEKMASSAPHIILEGMCHDHKHSVVAFSYSRRGPRWVPSPKYYQRLFEYSGLEIIDTDLLGNRIMFALKSDRVRVAVRSPDDEAPVP